MISAFPCPTAIHGTISAGREVEIQCPPGQRFINGLTHVMSKCALERGGSRLTITTQQCQGIRLITDRRIGIVDGHTLIMHIILYIYYFSDYDCGPVPMVRNGYQEGMTSTGSDLYVTVSCYIGHRFPDGSKTKTFKCLGFTWENIPGCLSMSILV